MAIRKKNMSQTMERDQKSWPVWKSIVIFFTSNREVDLDVVRGIAILLAIGWHLNKKTHTPLDWVLLPAARFGWAGVDLFFVLSGFLVGRMLFREHVREGRISLARFYYRRILRLWPIVYVFLICVALSTSIPSRSFLPQIALHVQNYFRPKLATHLWSLAVEEQFYLCASVGLVLAAMHKLRSVTILTILLWIPVVAFLLRLWASMSGWDPVAIQWQFQFRIDAIAAGVTLAVISIYYPTIFERILSFRVLWTTLAVLGFGALAFVDKRSALGVTVGFTLSWSASVSLILALYRSGIEQRAKTICAALSFFGLIAFPLYVWHLTAAQWADTILLNMHVNNIALLVIGEYAVAIPVAVIMRSAIELPLMLWRDRIVPSAAEAA